MTPIDPELRFFSNKSKKKSKKSSKSQNIGNNILNWTTLTQQLGWLNRVQIPVLTYVYWKPRVTISKSTVRIWSITTRVRLWSRSCTSFEGFKCAYYSIPRGYSSIWVSSCFSSSASLCLQIFLDHPIYLAMMKGSKSGAVDSMGKERP